jgi:hypothetical protein
LPVAEKVMGCASHVFGIISSGLPEDLHFQGVFGVYMEISVKAWGIMDEHDLLLPSAQFQHYLS